MDILLGFALPDRIDGSTIYQEDVSHWQCRIKAPTLQPDSFTFRCDNPYTFASNTLTLCWSWRPIMKDGINGDFSPWICMYTEA